MQPPLSLTMALKKPPDSPSWVVPREIEKKKKKNEIPSDYGRRRVVEKVFEGLAHALWCGGFDSYIPSD